MQKRYYKTFTILYRMSFFFKKKIQMYHHYGKNFYDLILMVIVLFPLDNDTNTGML